MTERRSGLPRPLVWLGIGAAAIVGLVVAVSLLDASDSRAASHIARLASLHIDYRLTPLALRRLGGLQEDFGVTSSGAVILDANGNLDEVAADGVDTVHKGPAETPQIESLAVDGGDHLLIVAGGYLGAVTNDPAARSGVTLSLPGARLSPSQDSGSVYLFGGAAGHYRLYQFTANGDWTILLDSDQPIVAATDSPKVGLFAATASHIVRLSAQGAQTVFAAPKDPDWGPIISLAEAPDGLLFFSMPSKVYALANGQAVSIVNDSGGSLRLKGDRLYVLDRQRALLYSISPASTQMFGGDA